MLFSALVLHKPPGSDAGIVVIQKWALARFSWRKIPISHSNVSAGEYFDKEESFQVVGPEGQILRPNRLIGALVDRNNEIMQPPSERSLCLNRSGNRRAALS